MSEYVSVTAADGHELSAYVARPVGEAKGAIVLGQEIFGINPHIRGVADGYAAEGYVVIAPATFDRYERGVELAYTGEDQKKAYELYGKLRPETVLLDMVAASKFLQAEGLTKIAVVGYCYGGLMAWLSSTRGPAAGMEPLCCVGYYPGGVGSVAAEEPTCPVMLHFGGNDSHIGADQREAVAKAHPEVEIFVYDGAEHGFNRDAGSAASQLAKARTLEFLGKYVG